MSNYRLSRFALVPLTASVLLVALVMLTVGSPTTVAAAEPSDWQQMPGHRSMTDTMPMHQPGMGMRMEMTGDMMQMMGLMHEMMHPATMPITGTMAMTTPMPMMGQHMGHMMQMMGLMMQMTGRMHEMRAAGMPITGTTAMDSGMPMGMMDMAPMMQMMQQMMGQMMPMTATMPMTPTMSMGLGMQADMMSMMRQMMSLMGGTMPVTTTAPMSDTSGTAPLELTQTAQVGAVEIKVTATNLQDPEADTLDFAIELNSHTQEIDLDLAETARLLIGEDEIPPTAWETATPKGHHVTGVLRFARTSAGDGEVLDEATEISLVIAGLLGNEERAFTWQLDTQ